MALRLGDLVEFGEIINTRHNSTHGWFKLRGSCEPVMFELTGDCAPDLRGKHIRFTAGPPPTGLREEDYSEPFDLREVRRQQVGPTGLITAARQVRVAPCTHIQFKNMSRCGEPPPIRAKRLLYLEWFSQNGRVVIELADPALEYAVGNGDGEGNVYVPLPEPAWDKSCFAGAIDRGEPLCVPYDPDVPGPPVSIFQRLENPEDELSSADLWNHSEEMPLPQADLLQDAPGDEEHDAALLDHLLSDQEHGETVESMLSPLGPIPDAEELNEDQAEGVVKALLAQLALCGVALHLCEHYTYRDALRLLEKQIIGERTFARQISRSSFVQHYLTAEHCQACMREMQDRQIRW